MSTQYDHIRAPYDHIRLKSIALIEHEDIATTIAPYIASARVLELACGSGFYTHSFLPWGASSVLALDISPAMLAQAQSLTPETSLQSGKVRFMLADAAIPTHHAGGPFDIVFGAWLLNYAADKRGLRDIFSNIALNLRPGGHFVSVTVPPTEDPAASIDAEFRARPPPEGSGGLSYYNIRDVDDGVFFHVHGGTPVGDVDFDCYHLRKGVHVEAAKEAGLRLLRWEGTRVGERWLKGEGEGGASLEELRSYVDVPGYGVLVMEKMEETGG